MNAGLRQHDPVHHDAMQMREQRANKLHKGTIKPSRSVDHRMSARAEFRERRHRGVEPRDNLVLGHPLEVRTAHRTRLLYSSHSAPTNAFTLKVRYVVVRYI